MNATLAAMILSWDKGQKIAPADIVCFESENLLGFIHPLGISIMTRTQFEQYADDIAEYLAEVVA